jgi:hypothetical protein
VKQIIVEEVSFKGKPKDYVLEFGKHRGKSIETIYKEGSDYLDWMISQEEFSNKEAQEMAKKYLASIKKAK